MKTIHLLPPKHGIHVFLPSAARRCRMIGMQAGETISYLAGLDYRRIVPTCEITQAVNLVFNTEISTTERPRENKPQRWLQTSTDRIHAEWKTTEQDLLEISDVHPKDIDQRELLECLFPLVDGLVCIGSAFNRFTTAPLAEHKNLSESQFILPCYMTSRFGYTQAGKQSYRALSNTGERRYIVLDFDLPPPDHHASIIRWMMNARAPVLVIRSGGKSLHAWYATETPERDDQFWRLAIVAGADPAILRNRAQSVRLPLGTRDNGNKQAVIYFNPNNLRA